MANYDIIILIEWRKRKSGFGFTLFLSVRLWQLPWKSLRIFFQEDKMETENLVNDTTNASDKKRQNQQTK